MSTKNHKANQVRWQHAERIAAEKTAILDFLREHGEAGFKTIQEATGINTKDLTNRIVKLRDDEKINYVGRVMAYNVSESIYAYVPQPGEASVPKRMADFPPMYLAWGGWAA